MRLGRKACCLGMTAAVVLAGAEAARAATVSEGFEGFSNPSATTIAGYAGPLGTWSDSSTASSSATNLPEVIKNDGTAYSGSNYLRLADSSTTALTAATLALSPTLAADGSTISFALRDDSGYNNNQVVIKAGTTVLAQIGLQNNSASTAKITYTPYIGSTAGTTTQIGSSTGSTGWFFFSLKYSISGTSGTYALTVTDPSNASFYSGNLIGNSGLSASTTYNISAMVIQTKGSIAGSADLDAFTVATPEPASLSLVGVGGLMMLKRRRR